jgi:hypothetical protein
VYPSEHRAANPTIVIIAMARGTGNYPRPKDAQGRRLFAPYGHNTTIRKFGHLLTWNEMNGRERAITRKRLQGCHTRNRYWKAHGYPNLVKARATAAENRRKRLEAGILPAKRKKRLDRVVAGEVKAVDIYEVKAAEIYGRGKEERRLNPMLGGLVATGLYDPEYLMRREMRILDVMSRCPV